jgi:hypothetical protein
LKKIVGFQLTTNDHDDVTRSCRLLLASLPCDPATLRVALPSNIQSRKLLTEVSSEYLIKRGFLSPSIGEDLPFANNEDGSKKRPICGRCCLRASTCRRRGVPALPSRRRILPPVYDKERRPHNTPKIPTRRRTTTRTTTHQVGRVIIDTSASIARSFRLRGPAL